VNVVFALFLKLLKQTTYHTGCKVLKSSNYQWSLIAIRLVFDTLIPLPPMLGHVHMHQIPVEDVTATNYWPLMLSYIGRVTR